MRPFPRLTFIGACIAATALLLSFTAPADAAEGAAVTLTWTPPADVSNVDYYQYRVSADGGTMWNPDWTIVPGSNAYTNRYVVTGLTFGVEYTFELRSANEFNFSNAISVTARALWPAPPNLAATPGDSQVALQWDRNPEINHYAVRIQGGATPVTQFVQSGSGSKTTATITELTNGTEYTFTVRGVSDAVSGSDNISASATVTATPGLSARIGRLNAEILSKHALTIADVTNRAISARMDDPCGKQAAAYTLAGGSTIHGALHSNAQAIEDGTLTLDDVLAGSSFRVPLAAANDDRTGGGLVVWGRGDRHRLESKDSVFAWDGTVLTGQIGIDGCLRDDLLTGLALSRSVGEFDYTDATGPVPVSGDYESRMTSVHPYLGWTSPQGLGLWATLGYGQGEIEIDDEQAGRQTSDTSLKTAAMGASGPLISDGSLIEGGRTTLMLKGEASVAQVEVEGDDDLIDKQTVNANRLRLALEGSHEQTLASGSSLTPSLELGLRHDGGDGITGTGIGIEIGGSLRYRDPASGLTIEGNGRVLAGQSDYREWGLGGSLRLDPGTEGRGLSFSLFPTWGETSSGVDRLWDQDVAELATDDGAANDNVPQMRLDSELGYGFGALGGHGLLTPYGGFSLAGEGSQRYRIGGRFEIGSSLNLSLEGERREPANDAAAEHGVMLRGQMRF